MILLTKFFRAAILLAWICSSASATTYYVCAATGSPCNAADTNAGTSKTATWLHAPGMPNCTGVCASTTPAAGDNIIFRGGDTWHFGAATVPAVGGEWVPTFAGTAANCDPSDTIGAVRTSCIYIGVDPTWFSGGSWTRPIMTGDNPTSSSTSGVASCSHNSSTFFGTDFNLTKYLIIDNFEWTGMCQGSGAGQMSYMFVHTRADAWNILSNNYCHGWTHVAFGGGTTFNEFCWDIAGNTQITIGPGNVCDGWDSDPGGQGCDIFGGYLIYDNVFGNMAQIVINGCHDSHDNLVYNYAPVNPAAGGAHGNAWECNNDAPSSDSNGNNQPNVPFNVYYNNVHMHDAAANATAGDVKLWTCANDSADEYWFGNIMYDMGTGNTWNQLNPCTQSTKHSYKFNNTLDLSASDMDCPAWMTSTGNHIIVEGGGTGYQAGTCTISGDIVMNHATAKTQGYDASGTDVTGNTGGISCANDTTPCAPTLVTNSTVTAATNRQAYCTALLGSTQSMIVNAGNACKNDTTDGCSYNTSTRSVSCPKRTALARPASTAWDAGAYQFAASTPPGPAPAVVMFVWNIPGQ
jgi:hypothetical protein